MARQRHVLWAGTRVLQVRGDRTEALVLRTGYGTARGRLIASIQLPHPVAYSFYKYEKHFKDFKDFKVSKHCLPYLRDSFKFLGVLSVLAIVGIIFTLYKDAAVFDVDWFESCTHLPKFG